MSQPIKAGDLCHVISGMNGDKSPNIGMVVKVLQREGEHTLFGPIWLCKAEYVLIAQPGSRDISPDCAHFAQAWLKKIEPPQQTTQTNVSKEITA